ncbi:hypothetical protein GCM10011403_09610 [Pseudohongiella nitratireducens]|uniref:Diguanylate cyclase/phosphodiesterase n=1 Tax=Pseudohongiella nitratireducens TaxID=1768907 RepID=A0A917LSM9_9GAMM|nr:EAL domain-containing protein [Pseudohongiella nitratireducens]GGG54539.1 hypothetical protein GCM10011403_09610 [Pseudohongiella nitratireducens]
MSWSGVHQSHTRELQIAAVTAAVAIALAFLMYRLEPGIGRFITESTYLVLHTVFELITISIAFMIFTVSWQAQRSHGSKAVKWVGAMFLAVATLDLAHLVSFPGLPFMQGAEQANISQDFRTAARLFAAAGLLGLAVLPASQKRGAPWFYYLAPTLALVFITFALVIVRPSREASVLAADQRQSLLTLAEFIMLTVYLVAAAYFIRGTRSARRYNYSALALAVVLTTVSEVFFMIYNQMDSYFALTAHVYKVLAYLVLYRVLFVETIQKPWALLRRSEQRLEATLNALPDVLFELNHEGYVLDVRAERQTGLVDALARFLNKSLAEALPEQAAKVCAQAMQAAMESGYARGYMIQLNTWQGERYFSLSVSYLQAGQLDEGRYLILARDINESISHQRQLQHEARLNEGLLQLARKVSTQTELDILSFAVEHARYLTESQQACLFVLGENSGFRDVVFSGGSIDVPESFLESALSAVDPLILNEPGTELSDSHASGIDRVICLTAREDGIARLLFCVVNKPDQYGKRDLETLEILAEAVWQSIRRKRQDSALGNLSLALEQSPNSVMITGLNGAIEYVNDAFLRNTGFAKDEVIGAQPNIVKSNRNPPEVYHQMWDLLMQGKPWQGDLINRRKDGSEIPERVLIYPVRDNDGNIINYISHKEDLSALRAADEKIEQLANYDHLTQLPNRDILDQQYRHALNIAREYQESIAVFCLNLDNFRAINDALGQSAGDEVLRLVASRLQLALAVRDIVTRQSADTFVAMLPGVGRERAATIASGLLNVIESPLWVHDRELNLTASVGVALYPGDGEALEILLMRAEAAMFEVKASGRNSIRFFEPKMRSQTSRFLEISNHLKHAIDNNELELVYQPQYSFAEQRVVAAEALLRWNDAELGRISPADFIPVAESNGFIIPISDWVVNTASRQLAEWRSQGLSDLVLAINLSAVQFRQSELSKHLAAIVSRHGVDPGSIEFELTEAVALQDPVLASLTMQRLKKQGFHLSIDDFGTGYSSMSYLKRFSVEKLKIDQSFVKDLKDSESDRAIVKAIIEMAHSLGMKTIAEGVETQQQLVILEGYGCDEIQGYLYSKPLSAKDFLEFLATNSKISLDGLRH